MKKLLFLLIISSSVTFGQTKQGKISYTEQVSFDLKIEGLSDDLLDKLPKSKASNFELLFTPSESLYQKVEEPHEASLSTNSGVQIEFMSAKADDKTYQNIAENRLIQKTDFMGKTFLVKGEIESNSWKLAKETKDILGYLCNKAIYIKDSTTYEAWYTTQIPVSVGPSVFVGLPGAILEVASVEGNKTITATAIELGEDFSDQIEAPKKGKQVTSSEFEKIKEEKFKEMEAEFGSSSGGGNTRVFIQKQ